MQVLVLRPRQRKRTSLWAFVYTYMTSSLLRNSWIFSWIFFCVFFVFFLKLVRGKSKRKAYPCRICGRCFAYQETRDCHEDVICRGNATKEQALNCLRCHSNLENPQDYDLHTVMKCSPKRQNRKTEGIWSTKAIIKLFLISLYSHCSSKLSNGGAIIMKWRRDYHETFLPMYLWGRFWNIIETLHILSWISVKLSQKYLVQLSWIKTRLQTLWTR